MSVVSSTDDYYTLTTIVQAHHTAVLVVRQESWTLFTALSTTF